MAFLLAAALTGCGGKEAGSGGDTQTGGDPESHEPVTLKLYTKQPLNQNDLDLLINQPLQKKYPYISVELIDQSNNNTLENYIASGQKLDLLTIYNGHIPSYKEMGIFEDITPLAKKNSLDLSRFDQRALDAMKAISDNGELYGIPYNSQLNALYYNKDIFDKFGAAYPKDGMTWDDAIELAKKLSREDQGVQYRGLDPESIIRLMYPLSLNIVDAKTNKVLVNSDPYKKLFDIGNRIYSIPGNKAGKSSSNDAFMKDRTTAMYATVNLFDKLAQAPEFNWDISQYPSYKDNPNVYGMYDLHVMTIMKQSKHQDEAMKVMEVLFSDEVQMMSTRKTGRVSPLKDSKFNEAFGADMPVLQGKHIQSIFKSKPASAPPFSKFYPKARDILSSQFKQFNEGKTDMNTALRDAEAQISQYIQGELGQ
jgi:multiple sugar transport system substrate-binding protein